MDNRSLVSLSDWSGDKLMRIIGMTREFEAHPNRKILDGKVIATLFFEPSTRTRLSFETAACRLGARVIGFADPKMTSGMKGESLKDTIMMVANYADLIIMRHYLEGAARYAAELSSVPVINAGDGANMHPTQTMLDLYTIWQTQGTLDGLDICLVGDLKYGRTVHSLLTAMKNFNSTFHFVSPEELSMPPEYKKFCDAAGVRYREHRNLDADLIAGADIVYMTRIQRERFPDPVEYEKVKDVYVLRKEMLSKAKPNLKILHPLPRVNEIDYAVDDTPYAYYFQQAKNGLYTREALICDALGMTLEEIVNDSTIL